MNNQSAAPYSSIFSMGLGLILVALVLFIALVQNNFDLAIPAGGVLFIGIGTRFWSRLSLYKLEIALDLSTDRLFQGEELSLTLSLENRKLLPIIAGMELQSTVFLDNENQGPRHRETRLLSFEKSTRTWKFLAQHRGVTSIGDIRISTGDLLGLHSREKTVSHSNEIIIYPKLGTFQPLNIPFQEFFGINASKGPVEDPAWYAGTRDYNGDRPAKNIHWKASARLGKLQEKLYEPTSHRKVLLVLDLSEYSLPEEHDDFEHIISTTGTLAAHLMETGASFGLVTNASLPKKAMRVLPIGSGPEHLGYLLEILARIESREVDSAAPLQIKTGNEAHGIVYCAGRASSAITDKLSDLPPRRRKVLFILSHVKDSPAAPKGSVSDIPEPIFQMGFPSYCAGDVVHAE